MPQFWGCVVLGQSVKVAKAPSGILWPVGLAQRSRLCVESRASRQRASTRLQATPVAICACRVHWNFTAVIHVNNSWGSNSQAVACWPVPRCLRVPMSPNRAILVYHPEHRVFLMARAMQRLGIRFDRECTRHLHSHTQSATPHRHQSQPKENNGGGSSDQGSPGGHARSGTAPHSPLHPHCPMTSTKIC